jgi:hypothetical protein
MWIAAFLISLAALFGIAVVVGAPSAGDAVGGSVAFETTFPSAGRYRLFMQHRVGAHVRTAAFTLGVAP